jgi:hypothetical protein
VLDDGTGRAFVEPNHARVTLHVDNAFDDFPAPEPGKERLRAFMRRHGRDPERFSGRHRFREGIIAPGETVAVAGQGVREPDPDADASGDYRSGPPTRLRMNGWAKHPLLISDKTDTTR